MGSNILTTVKNGIHTITFNDTRRRNAISPCDYKTIEKALKDAEKNPEVFCTVLTGAGDFYSSGVNFTNTLANHSMDEIFENLRRLFDTFIDYPKLLIAVVNGPAVGMAVTSLALCDIVYASERALFMTPFSNIGFCTEGCSSYTFPRILGRSKANEVLLLGHRMSAEEAHKFGLVSQIVKHDELPSLWDKFQSFKELSAQSISTTKKLVRRFDRAQLHEANKVELDALKQLISSEEFGERMMKYMQKKSKL